MRLKGISSQYVKIAQTKMLITIQKIEEKKSQKGDSFVKIKTEKGWLSCWRPELFDKFQEGGRIDVIVESKSGFYNIIDIGKTTSVREADKIDEKFEKIREEKREAIDWLNARILAKDILIAAYNKGELISYDVILQKLEGIARQIYGTKPE